MVYDEQRQRVVLFGGHDVGRSVADTWEWDGSTWTQHLVGPIPVARLNFGMAYDVARRRVVMHGGEHSPLGSLAELSDTWLFGSLSPATSQTIGAGCAGANGTPRLASGLAYLGNPAFRLTLMSARPSSACLFGISAGTQPRPIGPCTLYLADPIVLLSAVSNWAGYAETGSWPLPREISLRGTSLYAQGIVADPQAPGLGLAFSAGLRLLLGD